LAGLYGVPICFDGALDRGRATLAVFRQDTQK
jgi:hypothetical protein